MFNVEMSKELQENLTKLSGILIDKVEKHLDVDLERSKLGIKRTEIEIEKFKLDLERSTIELKTANIKMAAQAMELFKASKDVGDVDITKAIKDKVLEALSKA